MKEKPDIRHLFEPQAVAVVGASHNREKIGYRLLENIISSGYRGKVYPINPKGGEILGKRVYQSLDEVSGSIDVAFIVVPAPLVFDVVKACAKKGVKFIPIISSGFSEIGNSAEENKIVDYAHRHGMRIVGPNIFGLYSSNASLNATFGPADVRKGNVAIVTQSGALGISMMGRTSVEDIGLSAMVSVGNKSDVDEADILEYLSEDENTKLIFMYIEGVRSGWRLISALKKLSGKKPVIVLKAGRSKRGAIAAASHTGSLAGSDKIFSGIMKQCGVLLAESIVEALLWCKFLSAAPSPHGENSVIITNGGGIGVIAADACEKYGVHLYDDVASLEKIFGGCVPSFGSVKNPVDLTGQATIEDYEKAVNAALKSNEIDSIICLGCETALFDTEKLYAMINRIYFNSSLRKPMVFSFFGGRKIYDCINLLKSKNVPIYEDVYSAVSCLGALHKHSRFVYKKHRDDDYSNLNIDFSYIERILKKAGDEGRQILFTYEAQDIMRAAGIMVPRSRIVHGLKEAVKAAEEIGYPVVLKVVSRDIIHKSDVGGVALNLNNKKELVDAYEAITYNCKRNKPSAHIEGFEVSEMLYGGVEIIAGAVRDMLFGPVVMAGLGGVYVEAMEDIAFRSFPINKEEIYHMLTETKAYKLLLGVRGENRKDINSLVDTITKIGVLLMNFRQISDIEINPMLVYDEGYGVKALDVRILISKKRKENE